MTKTTTTERRPKNSYYEMRCSCCGKTFRVRYWGDSIFAPLCRSAPSHMGFWHCLFRHPLRFKGKYLLQYAGILAHDVLYAVSILFRVLLWPFYKIYEILDAL